MHSIGARFIRCKAQIRPGHLVDRIEGLMLALILHRPRESAKCSGLIRLVLSTIYDLLERIQLYYLPKEENRFLVVCNYAARIDEASQSALSQCIPYTRRV